MQNDLLAQAILSLLLLGVGCITRPAGSRIVGGTQAQKP